MMISAFRKLIKRLSADSRGVAALEFALAMPFIIGLFVASTDLMRLMLVHQKTERIAYNVADLAAQTENLTAADLQQIFLAPGEIMSPMEFGAQGLVILTSVRREAGADDATVRWRCSGGGTLVAESLIGPQDGVATLPSGLELNERENVLVAEVFYDFDPWFPVDIASFTNVPNLYKTAVFKPRFGALPTAPC